MSMNQDLGRYTTSHLTGPEYLIKHLESTPVIERIVHNQTIGSNGTIFDQNMTILRPTSKIWLDKKSGEVKPVTSEYNEIQAELLRYDLGKFISFIVKGLRVQNGLMKIDSYASATNVHELLAGNMLEAGVSQFEIFRAISPDQGIRMPELPGNIKFSMTGLLDTELKTASVGIWTNLPTNPRVRSEFVNRSLEIARSTKGLALSIHKQSSHYIEQDLVENITIYDKSIEKYIIS